MDPIPYQQFKTFFESVPGLYLVLSPDFTITAVSDAYLQATMTERSIIIGRNLFDVFPDNPDDTSATGVLNLRASLNYVLTNGKPHTMAIQKYDIRRHDGSFEERYWSPLNSPVFNAQQQISYIIHNVQDVTASVKAKDQLKKSENDFQLLVNNVKDYAIFLLDQNGYVASWNKGAENIKGYTAAEIIGKPMDIFYTAEDKQLGIPSTNLKITLKEGHLETEGWRLKKDGSLFYANIVFTSLIDDKGSHYGYAKVTKDITEKRRDEERIRLLASITSNIQDPVISSDNDFLITRWNAAAEKLLEWKSEEVIGKTTVEVLKTIYPFQTRNEILAIIDQKGIWQGELLYHTKSGRQVNVIATASKLKNVDGIASGNLILVRDITDRKNAEAALAKLNEELECKVKERTEAIKRSEKQYRYLFENNPMPMWVFDLATLKFLDVNEMAILHYGYSRKEFLSMTALDIRPEADKDKFIQFRHSNEINPGKYNKGTWNHKKKDGTIIQVEIIAHDIVFKGVDARLILANDVTDKLKAELKLIESEKRFRALIENNYDIISLMDESFKIIYRSPSATRAMGWTNEEIEKKDTIEDIHPEDLDYVQTIMQQVQISPGRSIKILFRNRHKNGHYLWMEGTIVNLLKDKHVKAILINFRDVTQRIETEEKLIASEKRFRAILENNNDIISLLDKSFNVVYRSPSAFRITGWTDEEMMDADGRKNIHPDDRELAGNIVKELLSNPGKPIPCLFRNLHKQGHYIWVEGVAINLFQEEHVKAIIFNFRDVSQRIEADEKLMASEKNLKAIFDNASEGFILTDERGTVKAFNSRAKESILLNIEDKITTGRSIFDFTDDSRKDFFKGVFLKVVNGETIQYDRLYTSADGRVTWIDYIFNPVKENNFTKGVCITGRDITLAKLAEQQKEFDRSNLNALINNTGDMMWSVDRHFRLITSNGAFDTVMKAITGTIPEKGVNILNMASFRSEGQRYKSYYKRAFAGETFTETEHSKLPVEFWSEISFNPIYEGGKVIGTACFSRDVTSRKRAEQQIEKGYRENLALAERMSKIINTLPANIALLDKKGNIVDVNDAWRKFADSNGFFGNNYSIGENYIIISRGAAGNDKSDGTKVASGIRSVLTGKVKEFVHEYPCHSPNLERWFRMVVTPLQENEQTGAVVMHVDISELRRLEKERIESRVDEQKKLTLAILQGQEKERNHLGRELHDNINQILAATRMFLSIAVKKNELLRDAIKYPMELLDTSIEEIRSLCQGMVTPLKNINLEDLIRDLLVKISQARAIETSFKYSVPAGCLSDNLKLNIYRVMQEVMNNVLKYAAASKVNVSLTVKDNILKVFTSDNGKGFDIADKRKGIGISNMINRMQSFNGNVEIKSSEGKGCQIEIIVPCS